MPSNTYTFQSYRHNPQDYYTTGTRTQNYSNIGQGINAGYIMGLLDNASIGNLLNSENVGTYTEPRDPDEDKFMRSLMLDALSPTILTEAANIGNAGNGINEFSSRTSTTRLDHKVISPDEPDQLRMFGHLIYDSVSDSGFRLTISQYSINEYQTQTGNTDEFIPTGNDPALSLEDSVEAGTIFNTERTIYLSAEQWALQCATINSCAPLQGDCANGFRYLYHIKPAATPAEVTKVAVMMITDVIQNPLGDGGGALVVRDGVTRANPEDISADGSPAEYIFRDNLPMNIEVGDYFMFGTVKPTTQCLPKLCCDQTVPRRHSYCSVMSEHLDCVYHDEPSSAISQRPDELNHVHQAAYKIIKQVRDVQHRMFQELYFGQNTYAAGKRFAFDVEGDPNSSDYTEFDINPFTTKGIMTNVDEYGWTEKMVFNGCSDTCGTVKMDKAMEFRRYTMQGRNVLSEGNWYLMGDTKPLVKFGELQRPSDKFLPVNYQDALASEKMRTASFDPRSRSMFSDEFNPDPMAGRERLLFQDSSVDTMHDSTLAKVHRGTAYFINNRAFMTFSSDVRALTGARLGSSMSNVYLPNSASNAGVSPIVFTQDLVDTWINGSMEMVTKQNCGLSFNMLVKFGIHPKANYLPYMGKLQYSIKVDNPLFDPSSAISSDNQPYIEKFIDDSDCGCIAAEKQMRDAVTYWTQQV